MTTTFPTDNRTDVNLGETTGDWTATNSVSAHTSAPAPVEGTNCMGMVVSNTTEDAYDTITSDDWSAGTIFVWMRPFGAMDTLVNGGVGIQVGDGTNREAYHVGGSDVSAFKHETGPHEWTCFLLDLGNKPSNTSNLTGTEANLDETAITQVGVYFETIAKSVGGGTNCFWDAIRWANPGDDVVMQGGTTSGAAGNGSEAAAVDRSTGTNQGYGVIRELGAGVYGIQGNLTVGNSASASDQYWEETNVTYAWEDRGLSSTNYYRFKIIGSSTATNCEASFTACTFSVPSAASASFDGNGADLTVCTITGCTFIGFDQGIETSDDTGDDWTGNTYIDNDQVVANGCDLTGSAFSGYLGAANTSALLYDLAADPNGELDNCTFTMPAASTHAIEFGTSIASSITLSGCDFFGYGSTNNANDSIFHFKDTGGSITLNLVGCTNDGGGFSYRTDGATITIATSITVTFTGIVNGTEIRVYNTGTSTEKDGVESVTGGAFAASLSSGSGYDVVAIYPGYIPIRLENQSWTASTSVNLNQQLDGNFENP